jgi:N-acyl-phosphatidylethanolamine-hydrolysing phospholipase D
MRIFRSSAIALALSASTLWPTIAQSRDTSELGPAPRTEDGRFDNWVGLLSHGGRGIRLPFFLRRIRASFSGRPGAPARVPNDGAFLRENAMHSTPTVTWVGHATVLVQMDHITFLTDPTWSDTASPVSFFGPRRYVEPGIAMEDLPPIDFVVISHNHYDHLDLGTLEALASRDPKTRFFVPLENEHLLRSRGIENVEALDWGTFAEHEGVRVYCLPAQHWSKRGPTDDLETLWSSWAVVGPERRFYFAGDTGYFDGFKKIARALGPFDLAALPIGAYEPVEMMKASHMNPEEAVQAALDLGARRTLAVHFGTFELADEALDDPPMRFRRAAESRLAEDTGWIFRIGETREF